MTSTLRYGFASAAAGLLLACTASAQSVCLPAPRLLTTMPMGGQAGTTIEVAITGQSIENIDQLLFSHSGITAKAKVDADGKPVANQFVVSIADDCPPGIHEARVMSRLGISASRVFSVGRLPEVRQHQPSTSVATAMPLEVNSICNATVPVRAVNHYSFQAQRGQRIIIDCAAKGIDSKMNPVLVLADAEGRDLVVERRGGVIDYTVGSDGVYIIKVHELTFQGGAECFYRLAVRQVETGAPVRRLPGTRSVSSFSWPPPQLSPAEPLAESEPNNRHAEAQPITLPADITGAFYPAADIDTFEFAAQQGETWWVEVASQRLGRPTDPSIVVQKVHGTQLTDIAELSDIPSPIKRSSNGYAYDGPAYNAGSSDILGKVEIKEDGRYRLQLTDLFGGTRDDPANIYRLIIRKAQPDFALVAWALHMELRNGDRNALSKPIALRGGSTMALEVVAVRRDGFDGEIELSLTDLPAGVTATGLKIPAGENRGLLLITADEQAPRGLSFAKFRGRALIDGKEVVRPCQLASMAWPVTNAWSEIPAPRLLSQVPVSVGGTEVAALSIAAEGKNVWEATAGERLTIPLTHTRRDSFSGDILALRTFGCGFSRHPRFEVSISADRSQAVLDLASLKVAPGDYQIAFYGGAVAKYLYNPQAVTAAESAHRRAKQLAAAATQEAERLAIEAETAVGEAKAEAGRTAAAAVAAKTAAEAAVIAAAQRLAAAKKQAQPRDIADIIVSEPIAIRVKPAETK